jgi:hypothetical protein
VTLQDLANFGEFIGAVGVVVSLLYLAREIRQNTKAVWLSAYDRYGAAGAVVRRSIIENADVARIYSVGLAEPGELDELERVRFRVLMLDLMQAFQVQFAQLGASGLGRAEWEATANTIRRALAQPGGRQFWAAYSSEFPLAFVEEISRLLSHP